MRAVPQNIVADTRVDLHGIPLLPGQFPLFSRFGQEPRFYRYRALVPHDELHYRYLRPDLAPELR